MQTVSPSRQRKPSPTNSDPCLICGKPVLIYSTSAGRGKMTHRACKQASLATIGEPRPTNCAQCGEAFKSKRRSAARGGVWIKCCSKSCNVRLQRAEGRPNIVYAERLTDEERKRREFIRGEEARRKRRARLLEVPRDPYTTASIAERDECICGLCGGLVDLTLQWPAPQSASVDHILPLSRGGDDTLKNVQLAHLACNLGKNNRI